jgi:hypothetical protein
MFRAAPKPRISLYLVQGRQEPVAAIRKGATKMNTYKFADYPSNSSVASGVTVLVSVWFLVAAGAILSDPPSIYTQRPVEAQAALQARYAQALAPATRIVPEARLTITVEAKRERSATL